MVDIPGGKSIKWAWRGVVAIDRIALVLHKGRLEMCLLVQTVRVLTLTNIWVCYWDPCAVAFANILPWVLALRKLEWPSEGHIATVNENDGRSVIIVLKAKWDPIKGWVMQLTQEQSVAWSESQISTDWVYVTSGALFATRSRPAIVWIVMWSHSSDHIWCNTSTLIANE